MDRRLSFVLARVFARWGNVSPWDERHRNEVVVGGIEYLYAQIYPTLVLTLKGSYHRIENLNHLCYAILLCLPCSSLFALESRPKSKDPTHVANYEERGQIL